ncbi:hypothetical protein ISS42_03205 [Candidatus Shapirobacteria bacterium]|nr:hypothetical protein [Candidatus Shapirobacteria bacterium]
MVKKIITQPVFWAGLDYYYGLGLVDLFKRGFLPNFFLICLYDDLFLKNLEKQGVVVFCLEREIGEKVRKLPKNTGHLLSCPLVIDFIKQKSGRQKPAIAYFKPSAKIDFLAKKRNWQLAANNAQINKFWENKINFYQTCKKFDLPVLEAEVIEVKSGLFSGLAKKWGLPFLAQSSFGWAGKSSYLIKSKEDWKRLAKKKGLKLKVTSYLQAQTLINNACLLNSGQVLTSPLACQITNLAPFTNNPLATCGREWKKGISPEINQRADQITKKLGKAMFNRGYQGFFGLDFLLDQKNRLYLIECNSRLTASSAFYHFLEKESGLTTLLEHHLLAFLKSEEDISGEERNNYSFFGGELIQRNTSGRDWSALKTLSSGCYSREGKLKNRKYFPDDEKTLSLFYAPQNKVVKPGDEALRLAARTEIVNKQNQINPQILKVNSWAFKNGF